MKQKTEKPKAIPIASAKEISKLGYDEVIIVGANYISGVQHVTTYGRTPIACENAAVGGNAVKKLLKWPENKCNTKPARQVKRERIEALERVAKMLIEAMDNPSNDDVVNLARFVIVATIAKKTT